MTVRGDRLAIRRAQARDLAGVVEIYNAGIAERVATFEAEPRTIEDISSWVEDGQPFIVAISNDAVVGCARAGAYSDRCVYQGVGEHAVYVHPTPAAEDSAGPCWSNSAPSQNDMACTG